jgi:hypothetical protein
VPGSVRGRAFRATVVHQPVPRLVPDLDPEWARLIDLCVARESGARPASAAEVQEILDVWAESRGAERLGPPARDADRPVPPIGGSLVGRERELEACAEAVLAAGHAGSSLIFCSDDTEPYCADALLRAGHNPAMLIHCGGVERQCAVTMMRCGRNPAELVHCPHR